MTYPKALKPWGFRPPLSYEDLAPESRLKVWNWSLHGHKSRRFWAILQNEISTRVQHVVSSPLISRADDSLRELKNGSHTSRNIYEMSQTMTKTNRLGVSSVISPYMEWAYFNESFSLLFFKKDCLEIYYEQLFVSLEFMRRQCLTMLKGNHLYSRP